MNRITFPILMLALSLALIPCWAAEPQPKASDNDAAQLKAAQDERIKMLTQLVEVLKSQYASGTADLAQVSSAENELWNALLDSTDEPQKRIALLTKQLDGANAVLQITERRRDAGSALETDVLRAKSICLGVKIKLLRERNGKSPLIKTAQGKEATGANEEYKFVYFGKEGYRESTLNDLAKQGWKVRTTAMEGNMIILAR